MTELNQNIDIKIKKMMEIIENFDHHDDEFKLSNLKSEFINLSSEVTKNLANLDKSLRSEYGKKINQIKNQADEKFILLDNDKNSHSFSQKINLSIPVAREIGKLHPITATAIKLHKIFSEMNFQHISSPEIESDYNNFTGLNTDENHPARSDHDTFYTSINSDKNYLLRTQTSTTQMYTISEYFKYLSREQDLSRSFDVLSQKVHLNNLNQMFVCSIGKTYRSDHDSTHVPMFHQIEAIAVGEGINLSNLKWCLTKFCERFFETPGIKMRFRPSYFPFTEPSIEIDIAYKKNIDGSISLLQSMTTESHDWLEVLGSGMINRNVFYNCGMDKNNTKTTGFAIGMGLERVCMLKNKIGNMSNFYGKVDKRWLEAYGKNHYLY